jgi:hypothetical protein
MSDLTDFVTCCMRIGMAPRVTPVAWTGQESFADEDRWVYEAAQVVTLGAGGWWHQPPRYLFTADGRYLGWTDSAQCQRRQDGSGAWEQAEQERGQR